MTTSLPPSSPRSDAVPDPSCCPLCGEANRCAMEIERDSGVVQAPCWCLSASFTAALHAQIPADARGLACLCARCVAAAQTVTPLL